jgi:hypothetical protein
MNKVLAAQQRTVAILGFLKPMRLDDVPREMEDDSSDP